MKIFIPLFSFLVCLFFSVARAQDEAVGDGWLEQIDGSVLFETESAFTFGKAAVQKSEIMAKPELSINIVPDMRIKLVGRLYADITDHIEPGRPQQDEVHPFSTRLLIGDRLEAELREAYIDIALGSSYLTIGKQQTVWGKADGLRIMDIVNPFNFREFIFDEFEDSRIPLWTVKADIPVSDIDIQLVWIPDNSSHDLPDPTARYALQQPLPLTTPVHIAALQRPTRFLADSDGGIRLSTFLEGWDITLNYLYHYDDFPVAHGKTIQTDSTPTLFITPVYERTHLLGTSFSNAFGSVTLRGEIGYFFGKYFSTTQGVIRSDQLMGVVGVDYSGISNTTLSAQVFQDWVVKRAPLATREQRETNVSLLLTRHFMNETLTAELIAVQNLDNGAGFSRAKVDYLLASNIKVWVGGEFIYGKKNSLLGQFREEDRVLVGLEWGL